MEHPALESKMEKGAGLAAPWPARSCPAGPAAVRLGGGRRSRWHPEHRVAALCSLVPHFCAATRCLPTFDACAATRLLLENCFVVEKRCSSCYLLLSLALHHVIVIATH